LGNPNVLKEALASIWQDLRGRPLGKAELETLLERCMALIPSGEEDTEEETAYADDAAASVACTIRARLRDHPQDAAWVARRAYDAVDYFLTSQIDSMIVTRDQQEAILSHPLVQAEFQRQQADLKDLELASAEKSLPASVLSQLRDRARRDAELFLSATASH
jgi:uncharacterized protein YjaG (DUF416 family)